MTTSEIATLAGYEEFAPWLLVEKTGSVHVVSINRPEALQRRQRRSAPCVRHHLAGTRR